MRKLEIMKITSRFIYSHSYLQAFAEDLGLKNRFYQSRSFPLFDRIVFIRINITLKH